MQDLKSVGVRCAALKVLRAGRVLTRAYDEALRPTGLTITQYTLLNAIGHYEPDSIVTLGQLLDIERTTLSRNLALLEKAGLVHLGEQGSDRKRELLLTTRGVKKLEEAYPLWDSVQTRVEALFDEREFLELGDLLRRVKNV
ncbi:MULTISPECIES: MarR family winged helix-turn-helix transcriptional regulator [Henriciella]|jgi:DNA-binding MarR family transcriptional regulator|uniref:MarR family transcriptional regulator n=1 Tax=Henriciella pelagia TaxID=1977912 RepID=A0ABQ1JEX2_9PROT|nr:MarR family transcriptional regulator [Henriciella pelagia]GGB64659.1 MarR family transcriptional regulator [Henriciella pelagia]